MQKVSLGICEQFIENGFIDSGIIACHGAANCVTICVLGSENMWNFAESRNFLEMCTKKTCRFFLILQKFFDFVDSTNSVDFADSTNSADFAGEKIATCSHKSSSSFLTRGDCGHWVWVVCWLVLGWHSIP